MRREPRHARRVRGLWVIWCIDRRIDERQGQGKSEVDSGGRVGWVYSMADLVFWNTLIYTLIYMDIGGGRAGCTLSMVGMLYESTPSGCPCYFRETWEALFFGGAMLVMLVSILISFLLFSFLGVGMQALGVRHPAWYMALGYILGACAMISGIGMS